jgi:hypothetical protein
MLYSISISVCFSTLQQSQMKKLNILCEILNESVKKMPLEKCLRGIITVLKLVVAIKGFHPLFGLCEQGGRLLQLSDFNPGI